MRQGRSNDGFIGGRAQTVPYPVVGSDNREAGLIVSPVHLHHELSSYDDSGPDSHVRGREIIRPSLQRGQML
ncbi:MAG: hypothetical protein KJ626_02740, partial [Verrucomicrobia bacterium]|nr:hypothetical protein [Verrucomicrobiota bacterium]